jgi:hypothetical protein
VGNSTIQLQELVDDAKSTAELAPALATGGYSDLPALSIANDVMQNMVAGGPEGQPFNWKWNRMVEQPFFLNSWQQDYFIPNLVSLGWLESCTATNFSTTQYPKPVRPVEVKRDLLVVSNMSSNNSAKICWMQNDTMLAGQWGQATQQSTTGLVNPGPGAVYTNPSTQFQMPVNPTTCVKDAFGNLWVVTTYGTCGNTNPFITNLNPTYPTLQDPSIVSTTATDGTVVWTALNPKGQGFRINPIPGQTGPVWQIGPVAQNRVARLISYQNYLDPVPDDYYTFFKQGFFAQCYRRSPDPKVRAKFSTEWAIWEKSLTNAVRQGAREEDDWGFYPGSQVMDTGYAYAVITPANPFGPWSGGN